MKHVFTKMSLAHLTRSITGGERKLQLDVNVHVRTRLASRNAGSPDLVGTIRSNKTASSTKLLVHETFEEFWTSITGDGNQHLFLKLITGGSFAGPAGTTISIAFKSYVHYTDITKYMKELEEYAQKICKDNENEAAYL